MKALKASLHFALCLAACTVFAGYARADVVFDNFGPGNTYDWSSGWGLSGPRAPSSGGGYNHAIRFTVTGESTAFDSAELALFHIAGANSLNVSLVADGRGLVSFPLSPAPGVYLETIHLDGAIPTVLNGTVKAQSRTHPLLEAGKSYWLVAAIEGDGEAAWDWNIAHSTALIAYQHGGGPWLGYQQPVTAAAFRISGTGTANPVPEPATVALLATGGLACLRPRRRR